MRKLPLRRLLSKLAVIALATSSAQASPIEQAVPDPELVTEAFIDPGNVDTREAAALLGRGLAIALEHFEPIEATNVATRWALSPDPMRRVGVARALDKMVRDILTELADPNRPIGPTSMNENGHGGNEQ